MDCGLWSELSVVWSARAGISLSKNTPHPALERSVGLPQR